MGSARIGSRRSRGVRRCAGRFVRAELVGIAGGIAAVLIMQAITHSRFSDIGGPIDVILIAMIWLAGAIGTTLLAYLLQSWRKPDKAFEQALSGR
jgi:hypothetical protein